MQKQLDMETGKQVIESINRLQQLNQLNSTDANSIAEAKGLEEYLKNQLFEHAGFLLGCWYAVRTEYEPLCNVFANITNRAAAINQQKQALQQVAQSRDPVKDEPSKIVEGDPMAPLPGESNLIAPEGAPLILKGNFRGPPTKSKR
jgi:hypothetical protein